jgi:LytS/YehU family sensor histidine kinase
MRDTLDIINKDSITIKEEIDYLKNYIVLENTRKNEKIEVDFTIEDHLDLFQKIPVMLVQPIVENVFIHAFDVNSQNPKITVRFYQRHDYIFIEVEDNGKGINAESSSSKQKSYATKIIENRLKILNQINDQHNTVSYTDLKNTETGKSGTLVKLIIATLQ